MDPHVSDPVFASGHASTADPETWTDFTTAVTVAHEHNWGIGFVLTEEDPFVWLDLDCAVTDAGDLADWMPDLTAFADAYVERSPSSRGLHVIGTGSVPEDDVRNLVTYDETVDGDHREVRIADQNQFTTITGELWGSPPSESLDIDLESWVETVPDRIARFEVTAGGEASDTVDTDPENEIGITFYDLLSPEEVPPDERVANPWHDSETGRDFRIFANSGGEVAWCYRCEVPLTPTHGLLMEYDVVSPGSKRCRQAREASARDVYEACEAGREDGLPIPEPDSGFVDRSYPDSGLAGATYNSTTDHEVSRSHSGTDEAGPSEDITGGHPSLESFPIDHDYLGVADKETQSTVRETLDREDVPATPEFTEQHLGNQRGASITIDRNQTDHGNGFPRDSKGALARTTFFARELDDPSQAPRWDLHHGLDSHDHADDRTKGLRINPDHRDKALRLECVLSAVEWPAGVANRAKRRALTADLRRFNAHYGGVDGAAWGFGFVTAFDDVERALDSEIADSSTFERFCERTGVDGVQLIERMFEWYG